MSKDLIKSSFLQLTKQLNPNILIQTKFKTILSKNDLHLKDFNKIHIYGFGKAVYNMAVQTELEILEMGFGDKIGKIEINIPESFEVTDQNESTSSRIKYNKAAKNNLPDDESYLATKSIVESIKNNIGRF